MTIEELFNIALWISMVVAIQGMIIIFTVWLLRRRQVWPLIMFSIKGGSLILKGYLDNTIEILHTKKPKAMIDWKTIDRVTGKKKTIYHPITKVHHTLKGTSYPIHFCPYTFPTNISILTKEKAELSQEEINTLMTMEYNQGRADSMITGKIGGFPIDKATLIMLFIVGAMVLVLIVFNYQILDTMNAGV